MSTDVLVVSSIYDFPTDHIVDALHRRGKKCTRINKEAFKETKVSLHPTESLLEIIQNGTSVIITPEVKSVLFRQPVFLRNTPGSALSLAEQLERSQWAAFVRALSVFSDAKWMNWPQATYLAECKPFQLLAAKKAGFSVPKTYVSNSPKMAEINIPGNELVIKSLDTILLREEEDCLFSYTQVIGKNSISEEECKSAPITFQEYIYEKSDIRVTVIEDTIFAVEILENGSGIYGDWRIIPRESIIYRDHKLPADIEQKCIDFVRNLGLTYGAIDLAVNKNGYHFIEINPTGEWGWLTSEKRPIHEAITDSLLSHR